MLVRGTHFLERNPSATILQFTMNDILLLKNMTVAGVSVQSMLELTGFTESKGSEGRCVLDLTGFTETNGSEGCLTKRTTMQADIITNKRRQVAQIRKRRGFGCVCYPISFGCLGCMPFVNRGGITTKGIVLLKPRELIKN